MKGIKFKRGLASLLFFLSLILFTNLSCKKAKNDNQSIGDSVQKPQTVSETNGVQQEEAEVPSINKLEKGKAEVETRLETLLSLVEEKEQSLIEREKRILEWEASLEARSTELAKKESSFRRQQILSWIVLVLGVGGMVFGFVIGRRKQKPPLAATEIKSKDDTDKKKAKITSEEVKVESIKQEKEKVEESEKAVKEKGQVGEKETPKAQSEIEHRDKSTE